MMSDEQPSTSKDVGGDGRRSQCPQASIYCQSDGRIEHESPEEQATVETLNELLSEKLKISRNEFNELGIQTVMEELTFEGLTRYWTSHGFKKIVTMVGAGISTSAGIPDFRTPSVGLYSQLEAYNLPYPRAIFDIKYFKENPKPFFTLCKDLYPGSFKPTAAHYFVRLLNEKGVLLRHYTQNIDALERIAGIPEDKLVEAHGTFSTSHCITCKRPYSMKWMKERILADEVPTCSRCNSLVKPDIVFYGETLPQKFIALQKQDFRSCDLLIIMGTSLEVEPFALLIDCVRPRCVRLLINRDRVAQPKDVSKRFFPNEKQPCLLYDCPENVRDIAYIGDCDDGVMALAEALGWGRDLKKLMKSLGNKSKF